MGEYRYKDMLFKETIPGVYIADIPYREVDMFDLCGADDSLYALVHDCGNGLFDLYALSKREDLSACERLRHYQAENFPELTFYITQSVVGFLGGLFVC